MHTEEYKSTHPSSKPTRKNEHQAEKLCYISCRGEYKRQQSELRVSGKKIAHRQAKTDQRQPQLAIMLKARSPSNQKQI
ncbi:hypothetical protein [Oscillatoria salina]|uniref:hypothetical protein n=1 Tax=Oscillatoria salina TaxID=331517 RepID=UPI0013B794B9|nr:hypothetical protein [Oscillatoria salina]MBZ8180698.1 hypothetical protein [Oscillatoria salina IIICB1]NET87564.1 hypothetical protein [Kamptonema sp. SIO1D9]